MLMEAVKFAICYKLVAKRRNTQFENTHWQIYSVPGYKLV
jgi:hypothetical protein